jgi:hypothetical protein
MLRRWRVEIIAGLIAVAVGLGIAIVLGLGRFGESESDRVREAALGYLHAFADGDPEELCEHISPSRFQGALPSQDCESTARTAIDAVPADSREALHDASVTVVSVGDDRAAVRFEPALAGQSEMTLVKVDDDWVVGAG